MPPKKKRKVTSPNGQPGIARAHLEKNFSVMPESTRDLKNGHVLYLYTSLEKSRAETERQLSSRFSLSDAEGYSTAAVNSNVKILVTRTLLKFKKLSNPKELDAFKDICAGTFTFPEGSQDNSAPSATHDSENLPPVSHDPESLMSSESLVQDTPTRHTLPSLLLSAMPTTDAASPQSGVSSSTKSRGQLTPRKKKLNKRLDFMATSKATQGEKYRKKIRNLQAIVRNLQAQLRTPKRVINQTIKRKLGQLETKDRKIQELKTKLRGNTLAQELAVTKAELCKLKKTHKQLLKSKKEESKTTKKTVSIHQHKTVQEKLKDREEDVRSLEFDNLVLKDSIETLEASSVKSKVNKKTYFSTTRMHVFDCIVNKTPTANIPNLLNQLYKRSGRDLDSVPQRSAVELMARELGAISELQTAEMILETKDVTVGFDATTQEEIHVNSIHFTTKDECLAAAVDELAGGTAEDYAQHICDTVDNLCKTYTYFNKDAEFQDIRRRMIGNITNTLSDRCAANHAAIRIVNSEWAKTLNELYCHLHPLDTIATSVRTALKKLEESRGTVFGNDCIAGNLILQMNKLRYKNGKGDPRGFVSFLDDRKIPRGVLPRYRGNRFHIIFHIGGKLIEFHAEFQELLKTGTSCGGLRSAILKDLTQATAILELQILGLLGKLLTGPWMKKFYTSKHSQINHVDGIEVVKGVITTLKEKVKNPESLITAKEDFFGDKLELDATVMKLLELPVDSQFGPMMKSCLEAIIIVLERQYSKYFELDVTEKLKEETASARSHNIDAEEIMGMFSASKQKAPNATICYLSSRMRSCKNKTVNYLDDLEEQRREEVLSKAVKLGRMQRNRRKKKQKELTAEMIKRQKDKEHARDTKERKKLEKKLKENDLESVQKEYPNLDYSKSDQLQDILNGDVVGRKACHVWVEEQALVVYNAKIEKLRKSNIYRVAYWSQSEDYDDATDYEMSMYQLAADLLHGDFMFC